MAKNEQITPEVETTADVQTASEAQTASLADTGGVSQSTPEVLQAASIMFVTVPIIVVYPFLQKYFVQGTMIGAVKG